MPPAVMFKRTKAKDGELLREIRFLEMDLIFLLRRSKVFTQEAAEIRMDFRKLVSKSRMLGVRTHPANLF
jgi:hypothetical protein